MYGGRLSTAGLSRIPLVDLQAQYAAIRPEVDRAIEGVLTKADFILGSDVDALEAEFAAYCGTDYAIGLDSGLSALELGMRALGIGVGDEVITPVHSFIASTSAISFVGATPIWVDVDPETYTIDVDQIEPAITNRTKAIMPVHLYGQPANMGAILSLAHRRGLLVIEDACQAHGAMFGGRRVGSFGDVGAFSFYPAKNLGAYGDGGIVVTNNPDVARRLRVMRNYGQRTKYEHADLAWNRRLDTLQAAVLRVKLPHLDEWNEARRRHAGVYSEMLSDCELRLPQVGPNRNHVFHLYVVQTDWRDELLTYLSQNGIQAGIHYPIPIHLQEAYRLAGKGRGSFPVSEAIAPRLLSLPMYPELSHEQMRRVVTTMGRCLAELNATT